MRRDQRNALSRKALIERITVVGTIPDKSLGSSQREGLSEGSFDKGDLMWRSRSRVHGEWKTRSVCNNHELRTLPRLVKQVGGQSLAVELELGDVAVGQAQPTPPGRGTSYVDSKSPVSSTCGRAKDSWESGSRFAA